MRIVNLHVYVVVSIKMKCVMAKKEFDVTSFPLVDVSIIPVRFLDPMKWRLGPIRLNMSKGRK
ncbi:MAG: hypothetical protein DRO94_00195 [Candidatus Altiarchaeales archaeon]|nr:MAG: hypothetical protein DRO95_00400 [Candidatus Altiarchaeales archaeon]RLI95537.1 MAG: hypothetical protein DRO94_00195 [Candidatus Altiarchaeales archaeon]HDO82559.1 hypothetical protein [Candidatus Altiarchaeales archaeon]HEX55208.1 hypothetical protein [Candidatus Altiarchaeales archaeon]